MSRARILLPAVLLLFGLTVAGPSCDLGADNCSIWNSNPDACNCTPDPQNPSMCEQTECPAGYVWSAAGGGGGAGGGDGAGGDVGAGGAPHEGAGGAAVAGAAASTGAGAGDSSGAGGGSGRAVPRGGRHRPRHHKGGENIGTAVSAQCIAVTQYPGNKPICRTDPPRFCAALCEYDTTTEGLPLPPPPKPYLSTACAEDNAGMLEALFADDVDNTLTCADYMPDTDYSDTGNDYVVNPTYFSITPVEVQLGVTCIPVPAPPPTESYADWHNGGGY
jgi:hypothetical protein